MIENCMLTVGSSKEEWDRVLPSVEDLEAAIRSTMARQDDEAYKRLYGEDPIKRVTAIAYHAMRDAYWVGGRTVRGQLKSALGLG